MNKRLRYVYPAMFFVALTLSLFVYKLSQNKNTTGQINPISSFLPKLTPVSTASPLFISQYLPHKDVRSTIFWIGEEATRENGYISNEISFWDSHWIGSYGGVDDPENRDNFFPADFVPKENPFYVALPYADFDNNRQLKESAKKIPWYEDNIAPGKSIVKNRWLAIGYKDKTCFAQWEDVGPGQTNDFDYVFGNQDPENEFSGIDLSPAVASCLEIGDRGKVWWQFVDEKDVPDGSWKQIITTSGINW